MPNRAQRRRNQQQAARQTDIEPDIYIYECQSCGCFLRKFDLCPYCGSDLQVPRPPGPASIEEQFADASALGGRYFDTTVYSQPGLAVGATGYVFPDGRYIARYSTPGRDQYFYHFTTGTAR